MITEKTTVHYVDELISQSEDYSRVWVRHAHPFLCSADYRVQWQFQGNFTACRVWQCGQANQPFGTIGMAKRHCAGDHPDRARAMVMTFSRALQAEVADLWLADPPEEYRRIQIPGFLAVDSGNGPHPVRA